MKSFFLAVAFSFISAFVFANNSTQEIEAVSSSEQYLKDLKQEKVNVKISPIHVTLSCGIECDIINFTGTFEELLVFIEQLDALLCGENEVPID